MKRLFLALLLCLPLSCFAQAIVFTGTALASAAQTATVNSDQISNTQYRGVHVRVNISAYTSGNFTPKIQGFDELSSTWYDILVGTALTSTGITILKVYPGIAVSANASASDIIPKTWRVVMTGAGGPSATFSVSYAGVM